MTFILAIIALAGLNIPLVCCPQLKQRLLFLKCFKAQLKKIIKGETTPGETNPSSY